MLSTHVNVRKVVEILGVPLDQGANMLGASLGPAAVRISGLQQQIESLGLTVIDNGDIGIFDPDRFVTVFKTCEALAERVYAALNSQYTPLILGGDHSIAIGSISGASSWAREKKLKMGLIWFDAHADINTPESSPSGNIHGMPLAALLGNGYQELTNLEFAGPKLDPSCVALIGLRAVDEEEKNLCRKAGIHYYTMRDIDERGMSSIIQNTLALFEENKVDRLHVSLDVDSIDPDFAPGVSTPVPGGITYREMHLALEAIADTQKLLSMDLVELNPLRDVQGQTIKLAIELILSALGKVIMLPNAKRSATSLSALFQA
ncbi:MAG: arginase [Oligoflexales bacterium]|nr:arginase [Oligoflexales bacterium]